VVASSLCPIGWEPAFFNVWEGTYDGCKYDDEAIEVMIYHNVHEDLTKA